MKKQIAQVLTFDVASKAMLAATLLLLIRYLQEGDFAEYTLATAAASVIATTVAAAFNRVYIVASKHESASETGTYVTAQIWCCGAICFLMLPFAGRFHGLYGFVLLLSLGNCLSDFAKTFYQRRMQFLHLSLIELLRTLLFLSAVAALITIRPQMLDASYVLLAQATTMLCVAIAVFVRRLTWRELFHVRRAWGLLREFGFNEYRYLTGYFILVAVLTNLVVFLLGLLRGQHEVAVFGSAFRYYNLLSLALVAVHVVLLPAIQQASDPLLVEEILVQHKRLVPLFACVVLLSAALAGWLIPLIDRGQYPEAIGVFQILAASALISFVFSPHINILLNARDFRFIFYVMLAGVMASAAAISLLIVDFGTHGAAWGFLLSFGVVNFVVYRRALAFRAMDLQTA